MARAAPPQPHGEFLRGSVAALLSRVPHAARQSLRHTEAAALLEPFFPRAPLRGPAALAGRRFFLAAVSDWQLTLVPISAGPAGHAAAAAAPVLEVPWLAISDVRQQREEAGDYLSGAAAQHTRAITIVPTAVASAAAAAGGGGAVGSGGRGEGGAAAAVRAWARTLGAADADGRPLWEGFGGDSSSGSGGGGGTTGSGDEGAELSWCEGDVLRLLTVERHSALFFHINAAWEGAHERAALAAARAPWLPSWAGPSRQEVSGGAPWGLAACANRLGGGGSEQALAADASSAELQQWLGSLSDNGRGEGGARPRPSGLMPLDLGAPSTSGGGDGCSSPAVSPSPKGADGPAAPAGARTTSAASPVPGAAAPALRRQLSDSQLLPSAAKSGGGAGAAAAAAAARPVSAAGGRASSPLAGALPRGGPLFGSSSGPAQPARPRTPSLRGLLAALQERAARARRAAAERQRAQAALARGVRARGSVAEAREAFRARAAALARPCSLLGDGDSRGITGLIMELALAKADRVPELHRLFFASPDVLAFAAARLTSWAAVCALPERAAAAGRSGGTWPQRRPRRLLRRLGLLGPPVDLQATLQAAAALAAGAADGAPVRSWPYGRGSEARGGLAGGGGGGCSAFYADPVRLSPLASLQSRYLFVERALHASAAAAAPARGEAAGGCSSDEDGSGADSDSDSDDGGNHYSGGGGGGGRGGGDGRQGGRWVCGPAPGVALWERLAARLCAEAAGGKLRLLLSWLRLQLQYSEGCPERLQWLSSAPLRGGARPAGGGAAGGDPTFLGATQALLAGLLTLTAQLPSLLDSGAARSEGNGGSRPAAAKQAAGADDDPLAWCGAPVGPADAAADALAGCLGGLLSLAAHARDAGMAHEAAELLGVVHQVPPAALAALVRRLFTRMLCLLSGGRDAPPPPAGAGAAAGPVAAAACGRALVGVLEAARAGAGALRDACETEIAHLLATPQVCSRLAAHGGVAGGVPAALNRRLLARVLGLAGAAPQPWLRVAADAASAPPAAAVNRAAPLPVQT
ncbi:hypothetical protein Rsub_06920 [Raphidocelis subcapitata]|uniref:Uncharacterized protein n=1 Tax=Raphidocelis subcapitata TaxID=307507 RepID=A0A2V0P355_9CHLO|nr:hypothetical protein Rsub_06920 [Raphidocelis subcapitata]|eukprot:GBF94298.1 hypothetical protein Rsub_06920 [Raphidocelis subcapitata]